MTPPAEPFITDISQPDLFVVRDPAKLDKAGCLEAPDWIIEIVSPSSTRLDAAIKYDLYAESGVGEYWLVFPANK